MPRQLVFTLKQNKRKWRGNCCEVPQYVCNYVDPSSDTFVSELRITSPGKDILRDLVGQERVLFLILLQSVRHGTSLKSVRADMKPVAHATCAQKFAVMITVALPTHIHTHTMTHTHSLTHTHKWRLGTGCDEKQCKSTSTGGRSEERADPSRPRYVHVCMHVHVRPSLNCAPAVSIQVQFLTHKQTGIRRQGLGLRVTHTHIYSPFSPFHYQADALRFKCAAFLQSLKSKIGLAASKAAALRISLNIQGCGIVAAPVHGVTVLKNKHSTNTVTQKPPN